jgi:hypothetical protein
MKLLEVYREKVLGTMRGLDRVRFRGTLRWLANEQGLGTFLNKSGILLKDFKGWALEKTQKLRQSCAEQAQALGVEMIYLQSSAVDKEALAREIAEKKGIRQGSICLFSVVESCIAPGVAGDRAAKQLRLSFRPRRCVWLYHYFDHPQLGFGHVRLQSWLPFTVFICLNGRHWLEKQLEQAGIAFLKDGNCFPWVSDLAGAQRLLEAQLETDWPALLNGLTLATCPALPDLLAPLRFEYYWSADETEWATDVLFRDPADLDALFPILVRHALLVSDSPAVMRYFGKRNITAHGQVSGWGPHEIISDCRRRYEGVRVKHWLEHNSQKMYNKAGSVLRFEVTINNTRDFRVFRPPNDDANQPASWQRLRKGVCDLHRRCQVSDQANERYADAIACAQINETLESVAKDVCNPVTKSGKRYRALNPWDKDDAQLLLFLGKGELALNGFRNKHLRSWLYPKADENNRDETKRLAARVSRIIRLLRAHGLVKKIASENRYILTDKGQKFATALLSASAVDIHWLIERAA